jgi:hypothetical protein
MNQQTVPDKTPLTAGDIVQTLAGFAVAVAVFYSWLFTLSFGNRIAIQRQRNEYKPAVFVVTGATYDGGGDFGPDWWLTGLVGGRTERLVPDMRQRTRPQSADDLLQHFPTGSQIDVLYNPTATETLWQGESLRVLEAQPDFWQREARSLVGLGLRVLLPVPVTAVIYTMVRYTNHRRRQMKMNRTD